ncbi:hypothetical protein SAMN05444004_1084 [Jannaschia faecimaris]|uniref:Uncharacterized protein n=1 Tax=Jannaschia faecimaris TaxID=1244108 RepID=A0A1H3R9K8_9RHOB|nr:hypothetical protein [Jannaschia faecimaris]SDZ22005.1 hypothetical protein SAMN05444004_1084 [Jannaschia faecimaris]
MIDGGYAVGATHQPFDRMPFAVRREAGVESAFRSDPLEIAGLLQAAESIAFTGAGTSGHILLGTPERFGVADAINSKSRFIFRGVPVQLVVAGEANLVIASLATVLATLA